MAPLSGNFTCYGLFLERLTDEAAIFAVRVINKAENVLIVAGEWLLDLWVAYSSRGGKSRGLRQD